MKKLMKFSFIALVMGLCLTTANAQNRPAALTDLYRLVGSWQGPTTLVLEGSTYNFTYHFTFSLTADSSGIYMEEWFTHPALGTLRGTNLIGYNNRDQNIQWFSVDNFGTTHVHFGHWVTPDHFYMDVTEKHGGQKFEEKIDITFQGINQITIHLVAKLGNTVFEDVSGVFSRQP
jgi:hypothetical protein